MTPSWCSPARTRASRARSSASCRSADKVIVSGVNTATKHAKARRANDKAGIIDRDMPIHVSNVALVHKGKPVRLGYEVRDGKKVRVARVGGGKTEVI